jgi:polysaccharide deacetylase 2 family uncharacterized protein YibQ
MARRRKQPARRKKGGGRSWLALLLLGAAVFAAGLYLGAGRLSRQRPAAAGGAGGDAPAAAPSRQSAPAKRAAAAAPATFDPPPAPASGARIALVVDDLGRSLQDLDTLAALGVPLSYAVLPFESMTPRVVATLRERRAEILLHLPMEPRGAQNPGPGALREGMSGDELRRLTRAALAAVPGAVGVNNHMGSEISADPAALGAVMGVVAESKLFYLDSRTSAESRGYALALELGIPAAERQVFLDPDPRESTVVEEWNRLLALARERGAAVAIGHPHPQTLAVLQREVPRARRLGYEFVPVSYLLDRTGELPE